MYRKGRTTIPLPHSLQNSPTIGGWILLLMDANRDPESCSKWIFKKANNASITLRYQIVPDLGFFESYRKPKQKKTKKKKKERKRENYDLEFLERSLNIISRETQFKNFSGSNPIQQNGPNLTTFSYEALRPKSKIFLTNSLLKSK
jgi:hypothetical protein